MKYLGLDMGTNSIGWALRDEELGVEQCQILESGVHIFSKGVAEIKGVEFSKAAERTGFRSVRKRNYRRKLRKVQLLRALIALKMCPLATAELDLWANYQKGKSIEYPQSEAFASWVARNPYECRHTATQGKVDAMTLGRALYHICQRRGFKSGKKDAAEGAMPKDVEFMQKFKEKHPNQLLINQLYEKNKLNEQVRNRLDTKPKTDETVKKNKKKDEETETVKSSRLLYSEEFEAIMAKQNLPLSVVEKLYKAIFFQRPLKSQKHTVGKCTLEKNNRRAAIGSTTYELFRLHQQLNNVLIWTTENPKKRQLNDAEKELVKSLFFRKNKENFDFEEIKDILNKDHKKTGITYISNYDGKKVSASGCPTIARLKKYCGEDWQNFNKTCTYEYQGKQKTIHITAADICHVWENMPDDEHKVTWAMSRLGLSTDDAEKFGQVRLKDGYASLSEKAMKKIIPFLEKGYIYSLAVFLANIETIIGTERWNDSKTLIISELDSLLKSDKKDQNVIAAVNKTISYFRDENRSGGSDYGFDDTDKEELSEQLVQTFGESTWSKINAAEQQNIFDQALDLYKKQIATERVPKFVQKRTFEVKLQDWLMANFDLERSETEKVYHPSAIETYQKAKELLGSPMLSAVRNPMAMKALHELRHLINELITKGIIDDETHIIVELSRELNDTNKRAAIQYYQRAREKERKKDREVIKELYKKHFNLDDYNPTERDFQRFRFWIEQNKACIYTGKPIACADLFNSDLWDREHTLPRSRSFDNSQVNLTICCADYNRKIKQTRPPFELYDLGLANKDTILLRLKHWKSKIIKLEGEVNYNKKAKGAEDKNKKDTRIQNKHYAQLELNYWKSKYDRFTMEEIKDGFKNSQLVDTGIITKYATLFLKSYFQRVSAVKGTATAEFRKIWGLQAEGETKERINHNHHLMDAIVISCMTKKRYDSLAAYYYDVERKQRPTFKKPWRNFNQDIAQILDNVLVVHSFKDNTLAQTKKKKRDEQGNIIEGQYVQGRGIRGSLHKDTFYGKIIAPSDGKAHFVKRVSIMDLKDTDVAKIVDLNIRQLFLEKGLTKVQKEGLFLQPKVGKKKNGVLVEPIYTPIKKVRVYQEPKGVMPLKKHSHLSKTPGSEYKHFTYVANDENYMTLLLQNKDKERKIINLNYLDISKISTKQEIFDKIVTENDGYEVLMTLQKGLSVIFFEKETEKNNFDFENVSLKNLYLIKQMSGNDIILVRVDETRPVLTLQSDKKENKKTGFKDERKMLVQKSLNIIHAFIEGTDFTISPAGEILQIIR